MRGGLVASSIAATVCSVAMLTELLTHSVDAYDISIVAHLLCNFGKVMLALESEAGRRFANLQNEVLSLWPSIAQLQYLGGNSRCVSIACKKKIMPCFAP